MPLQEEPRKELTISNLPLLAAEVEQLLDVMEDIMAMQRRRRLDQLRAPNWFRRNWYVVATSMPTLGSFFLWMARRGRGQTISQVIGAQCCFFPEGEIAISRRFHVRQPRS